MSIKTKVPLLIWLIAILLIWLSFKPNKPNIKYIDGPTKYIRGQNYQIKVPYEVIKWKDRPNIKKDTITPDYTQTAELPNFIFGTDYKYITLNIDSIRKVLVDSIKNISSFVWFQNFYRDSLTSTYLENDSTLVKKMFFIDFEKYKYYQYKNNKLIAYEPYTKSFFQKLPKVSLHADVFYQREIFNQEQRLGLDVNLNLGNFGIYLTPQYSNFYQTAIYGGIRYRLK